MNRKANSKIMKPFIVSFFILAQAINALAQMPMQAPRMNMPSPSAPQVPNSQQRAAEEQSRIQQQNAAMMQRQTQRPPAKAGGLLYGSQVDQGMSGRADL